MTRPMRNYTCTRQYCRDEELEGNFIATPVISTDKILALTDQIEWSDGAGGGGGAAGGGNGGVDDDEVHSLHLRSLIDHYLESEASSPLPSTFCANSPLLPYPTYALNHIYPSAYEDHKSLILELQAAFQNVGENYGELRKEIVRATRKGGTHMHSCAHAAYPSYEILHVLVLEHLRKMGFNAGICKSERDPQKNPQRCPFPAEEYEYMDVIQASEIKGTQAHASERVIIDLRFRSQFEIARPSTAYMDLLKVVPTAYVGSPRVLQKVLRYLSEAMKTSLESQGMALPPWRRLSFLHSKWLSPHYSRSNFAPPLANLNHITNKPSTKRENFLCSTHKSPSSFPHKREHCIMDNNPTCGLTKPSPFVDIKHKPTKTENSFSLIHNPPPFARPPLLVDSKRILKSRNLTSHIPRNGSNKQLSGQSGEAMKVPWKLPSLANPSSSLKQPRRLVGALTLALRSA